MDGKYRCDHPDVFVLYDDCLKISDRVFFLRKIHRIVKRIEEQVDLVKVTCIIAGTLYSDGFVAYLLHQKYSIPFSVALRETDVTYQMKWRPYLNRIVKHLLDQSTRIIFLSPTYRRYIDRFGIDQAKYKVIPNAVNDYWFNSRSNSWSLHDPVSLIYVGEISKRKNVCTTISAVAELNRKGVAAQFRIIGTGDEEESCRALAKELCVNEQVFFHGWQNGKEKLKEFYDQSDIFVMPSYRETFGTVYIEAMSQGLPVIYSKGQGIDGYFAEGSVGYGCDPDNVDEVVDRIKKIIENYSGMSKQTLLESRRFRWEIVAGEYNDVIQSMRKE